MRFLRGDTVYSKGWKTKVFLIEACAGDYTGLKIEECKNRHIYFSEHDFELVETKMVLLEVKLFLQHTFGMEDYEYSIKF